MATGQLNGFLRHLRTAMLAHDGDGMTDAQLLGMFIERRDEAAFEALLCRHGPMVLGVCRRVLRNHHDAEDAFQATFLVLVRKAASVVPRAMVGNWLYGVAYRTALKARAASTKRREKEKQACVMPEPDVAQPALWRELQSLLDEALDRLPDSYRAAVVLCDLEGKTYREAARQLGWPVGTLTTRLSRARVQLAKRLTRHGWALSAGSLALMLSEKAASACVPAGLEVSTVKAATLIAAGQAAAGVIPAKVAALMEGVLKAMLLTKLKFATAVLLVVGILGGGAGVLMHQALAAPAKEQKKPAETGDQVEGVLKAVDAAKNKITLTITIKDKLSGQKNVQEQAFDLAADASIVLTRPGKEGEKAVKLADLKEGMRLVLRLSQDKKTATNIQAAEKENTLEGAVKAVDAAQSTLTLTSKNKETKQEQEKKLDVAADARIVLARHGKDGEKEVKLADLKEGMRLALRLSQDSKAVVGIRVAAPTASGVVKAVDAAKHSITVTHGAKDNAKDITYEVEKKAPILIDGKEGKLADLKVGMPVHLLLSPEDGGAVGVQVSEKKKGKEE